MRRRSFWCLGLGAVAAGLAARTFWSRWQAVSVVPPEMRTPLLYLWIEVRSRRALRVLRTIPVRPAPLVEGVGLTERDAPAGDGSADVPTMPETPPRLTGFSRSTRCAAIPGAADGLAGLNQELHHPGAQQSGATDDKIIVPPRGEPQGQPSGGSEATSGPTGDHSAPGSTVGLNPGRHG